MLKRAYSVKCPALRRGVCIISFHFSSASGVRFKSTILSMVLKRESVTLELKPEDLIPVEDENRNIITIIKIAGSQTKSKIFLFMY